MKKIHIPGSKSISNRVLYLSALSPNPTILYGLLQSDDTKYMQNALESFGVKFEKTLDKGLKVIPPEKFTEKFTQNFIGNAGTAARFLSAFSLVANADFSLTGVDRMSQRPFEDLFHSLRDLGVEVQDEKAPTHLPARFVPTPKSTKNPVGAKPGFHPEIPEIKISGEISSQFLSGLLLTAPRMPHGLQIKVTDRLPSRPYVEMTIEILKQFGVKTEVTDDYLSFHILPGIKNPDKFYVPGDSSAASIPVAYSLLSGKEICIENFGEKPMQGDAEFLKIAEKFNGKIIKTGDSVTIIPQKTSKKILDFFSAEKSEVSVWENPKFLDFEAMPDVSMTGMVLAAVGKGTTKFTGLESLRVKECDRIQAMKNGLEKLGIEIKIEGDDMYVTGNSQKFPHEKITPETEISSEDDHRIAFCFALLQQVFQLNFTITQPECVTKTWPNFWIDIAVWQDLLRPVSAIVIKKKIPGKNDLYLIVKKPRITNAWQFPQGGKDEGETYKMTAMRELKEECGADIIAKIKGERPVTIYRYIFPSHFLRHAQANNWKKFHGAEVQIFLADYISGEVKVDGKELVGHSWMEKAHLPTFFSPEYANAVMKYI